MHINEKVHINEKDKWYITYREIFLYECILCIVIIAIISK